MPLPSPSVSQNCNWWQKTIKNFLKCMETDPILKTNISIFFKSKEK